MNTLKCFLAIGLALLVAGCPTRSLSPLFAEKDLVFNPSLIGTWGDPENNKETLTFVKSGEKSYEVTVKEKEGESTKYRVQLGKIWKRWFLDSHPGWRIENHHVLAVHIISRISLDGDTLRLAMLEADWLKKMIEGGKLKVPHAIVEGDVILTGTTEELQAFVARFAEEKDAFPNPATMVRRR